MADEQKHVEAFKEELILLADMGKPVWIYFKNPDGDTVSIYSRIEKVYEEEGSYFIMIEGKVRISIFDLISVNGQRPEYFA